MARKEPESQKEPSISGLHSLLGLWHLAEGSPPPHLSADLQLLVLDTLGIVAAAALPCRQGHGWSDSDIEEECKALTVAHNSRWARVQQVPALVQVP